VHRNHFLLIRLSLLIALVCATATAQTQLSPEVLEKIDALATRALSKSGVPSASIAVVKDGQVVYVKAYGDARLDPKTAASGQMRYSIGSISKQFTAASVLLLQEQGKLSLDDKVAKYIPDLTRANEVTIRQLLSHTSGYQDYWPQDYVMPMMLQPVTAQKIMDGWARKALDFDPGSKWQYSNTNFVIAGVIVEKVSGKPLLDFMQEKNLCAARYEECRQHGSDEARDERSGRLSSLCAWSIAAGAERSKGLALRSRRTGDDCRRSREVGHFDYGPEAVEACVVS
jgi:D-alanyl-D-alanine carboxypeptidase